MWGGGGEVAADAGGGSVGAVAGQDLLEDVDGVGDVVAVGDHQDQVLDLPPGDRHVHARDRWSPSSARVAERVAVSDWLPCSVAA